MADVLNPIDVKTRPRLESDLEFRPAKMFCEEFLNLKYQIVF